MERTAKRDSRSRITPPGRRARRLHPGCILAAAFVAGDAVTFKYIAAPLGSAQLDELLQLPAR